MKRQFFNFMLSVCVLFISTVVAQAEAPLTGDDIAYQVFNREDGSDPCARMEMILIDM